MEMTKNILIVGVGGQGTILASRVLSQLLISRGYDIKVSEIHGMSQRGGSVITQVRFGEKVFSPIIATASADYILAFERLEAIRALPYLREGGHLIINDQIIDPMPVVTGVQEYPKDIDDFLKKSGIHHTLLPARGMALTAGNQKVVNMVLLGAWAKIWGLDLEEGKKVLTANIPPKLLQVNLVGFEMGYRAAKKA